MRKTEQIRNEKLEMRNEEGGANEKLEMGARGDGGEGR